MKAVAVLVLSVVVLAPAGAPFAEPRQPMSNAQGIAPTQSRPADSRMLLAQVQLPTIDRPVQSHDTASAMRVRGHFFFETEVNGVTVPMMFDTGASLVALRAEDAARVGISASSLNYTVHTMTANGVAESAPVVIKVMKVGTITRTNIQAVVAKPGALGITLLGQSFMATMAGFSTEGDRLTLRGN